MNYLQFRERLLAEINGRMAKHGIKSTILPINIRLQPEETLYLGINHEKTQPIGIQPLYEMVRSEKKSISDLATVLLDSFETCNNLPTELCEENLVCGLVNMNYHKDLLKTIPHIPFFDMAITLSKPVKLSDGSNIYTMINEATLNASGYKLTDLYWPALKRTFENHPTNLFSPARYIKDHSLDSDLLSPAFMMNISCLRFLEDTFPERVFMLTCENYMYGGTGILNYMLLQNITELMQSDLYILPYTQDAFIIIASKEKIPDRVLNEIRNKIPQASAANTLSEKTLYFDRCSKKITEVSLM